VGGTYWETAADGRKTKHWSRAALRLDTRKLVWTRLPDYPVEAGYASAMVLNGRLYVAGGRSESRGNSEVFVLDPSQRDPQWRPVPPLPAARWGHAGGVVGTIIYLAAGSEGDASREAAIRPARDVLAFDTEHPEQGWHVAGRMPDTKVEWQSGAACGGKLYLFGGLVADQSADKGWMPQTDAMAFDPRRKAWEEVPPLPRPSGSGAATALDDRFILLASGYGIAVPAAQAPDGKARTYFSTECLLYDTIRREYRRAGNLPMGVTDEGLAFAGDRVVAIGGEDSPWQTRTDLTMLGRIRR
jgi:N-acetylneuraminic acid mutarotase